jgi:PGF-pre-PGF domain-containing protein
MYQPAVTIEPRSRDCVITGFTIDSNGQGIGIYVDGNNNTIYECNIQNNDYSLRIGGGTLKNLFYHNNFIDNADFMYMPTLITNNTDCRFDNDLPDGGNYWSNNPGCDNPCHDPLEFTGTNFTDNYPFQDPDGWNQPPLEPSDPVPENGAIDVPINMIFRWSCSDPDGDTIFYEFSYGLTQPLDIVNFPEEEFFEPETLDYNTTYFWQVGSFDEYHLINTGPIWNFTTEVQRGPTINIDTPSPDEIIYTPIPTILAHYYDSDGVKLESLNLSINNTNVSEDAIVTEEYVMYQPQSNLSYGKHNVSLNIQDYLGFSTSVHWSFIINQSAYLIDTLLGNISFGNETNLNLDSNETEFISINFTSLVNLSDVEITLYKLFTKPDNILSIPKGIVKSYVEIRATTQDVPIPETSLQDVIIYFKVDKRWVNENQIDNKSIMLVRYYNSSWQNLSTYPVKEDEVSYYYLAETPGFSTFAVVGAQIVEIQPYGSIFPDIPWFVILGLVIAASLILIIILFKGKYIYHEERSSGDDSEGEMGKEMKK